MPIGSWSKLLDEPSGSCSGASLFVMSIRAGRETPAEALRRARSWLPALEGERLVPSRLLPAEAMLSQGQKRKHTPSLAHTRPWEVHSTALVVAYYFETL